MYESEKLIINEVPLPAGVISCMMIGVADPSRHLTFSVTDPFPKNLMLIVGDKLSAEAAPAVANAVERGIGRHSPLHPI